MSCVSLKETPPISRFISKVKANTLSLFSKDETPLIAFLLLFGAAWTLSAGLLPSSMSADNVEEIVWSQTWQWGYYKHPPLPSMLLAGLNALFQGPSIWLTIGAAQVCNIVALLYVWQLAKRILPHKLAIVAVLLTSLIAYHHVKALEYNHNTVSLPVTAAAFYYFYCATKHPQQRARWLQLGMASGLAMLTKYSAVLIFASFFIYLVQKQFWKNPQVIQGVLLSFLVFGIILSPHLIWLVEHQWLPFVYLDDYMEVSIPTLQGRIQGLINFSETQTLRLSGLFVAVLLLIKITPRQAYTVKKSIVSHKHHWHFLLILLFVPLILATLPMLLKGGFLSSNWVTAFFLPAGIVLVHTFFRQHDEERLLQNTHRLVWVMQLAILLIFLSVTVIYPAYAGYAGKSNYPSQQLAENVSAIWHEHQNQPLRIVIADTWLGGNVLLHIHPEPTVLLDNNPKIAPWVNHQDVADCGALVLTTEAEKNAPAYAGLFKQARVTGAFSLQQGLAPHAQILNYAWAILPPVADESSCRLSSHNS